MRRSILMAVVLAAFVAIMPASALAKTKPVPGTFQLVVRTDYPLRATDVMFTVELVRGKKHAGHGPYPNRGDDQVVVKLTQVRPGDVIYVTSSDSHIGFGPSRRRRHVITKSEAKLGAIMDFELPYVQTLLPSI